MTKTADIFSSNCPYDNYSQTAATRLLFVCSAGMLRSPTCANVGTSLGFNTRAAGSHTYALIPINAALILWAKKIIFVNKENYTAALATFVGTDYEELIKIKAIVWDIKDTFNWGDFRLMQYVKPKLIELKEANFNT